jgi:hypothetical protein
MPSREDLRLTRQLVDASKAATDAPRVAAALLHSLHRDDRGHILAVPGGLVWR